MNRGTLVLVGVVVAVGFGGAILWRWRLSQGPIPTPELERPGVMGGPSTNPASGGSGSQIDRETVSAWQRLEAERQHADATDWAVELRAQAHEEVFVELWDSLRAASDPWEPLKAVTFDEIRIGAASSTNALDLGVVETFHAGAERRWTRAEAVAEMERWRGEGWRCVQSEFRHRRYSESPDGTSTSVFHVSLHLRRESPPERAALTTELEVEWKPSPSVGQPPFPARLRASELVIRRRPEAGGFVRQLSRPLEPPQGIPFVDPLIVYDVDGNGFPEIILGCAGELIRNRDGTRFERARWLGGLRTPLLAQVIADVDGDSVPDLLGADHDGLWVVPGSPGGRWWEATPRRLWSAPFRLENPVVLAPGDVDSDGDLDVWLAQYKLPYVGGQMPTPYHDANDGFPGFLLVQETDGSFRDATAGSGLEGRRHRRAYSAVLSDLDDDGDLDLSVVSDFAGLDVFANDGKGRFSEVTGARFGASKAFGMGQALADFDGDARLDLLLIGMNSFTGQRLAGLGLGTLSEELRRARREMAHGNRLYLGRGDRHTEAAPGRELVETGWSWGATAADFDNDGDLDVCVVNGHKSRGTVRDYERQFWLHDIQVGTSELDPVRELYFQTTARRLYGAGWSYGGFEKNRLLLAQADGRYAEAGWLLDIAYEDDFRNVVGADLDGDGRVDLVATTYGNWPEGRQGVHVFRNEIATSNHWIGFRLSDGGPGRTTLGGSVRVWSGGRVQRRWIVAGDGYR
ncbi:MAG: FG-GAP repeat domain-containing protein, partial [Limisphaerales bacterium]